MIRAIRIMLIPNNFQNTRFFQYAGASRFAYNWALAREKDNYEQNCGFLLDGELKKEFTKIRNSEENIWLTKISNNVTKMAISDACNAYISFFKGKSCYPRYKSKKHSMPKFFQSGEKLQFTETHVKLEWIACSRKHNRQKLNWVKLAERGRIPINAKYYNPRISFDGINWWLSVGIELPEKHEQLKNEGIGIDVGVKDLAICSDGYTYGNINKSGKIKKLEKKKRRFQRCISRKYNANKKGGKYCKTKSIIKEEKLLLKLDHKLKNIRRNYIHQTTTEIINRKPRFICVEDLNVCGMMKNRYLSKSIQNQNLYEFRRQLEYKCENNSIRFILADRFYPSSKLCTNCGKVKKDLKLSDRIYKCECGNVIDRDFQAAINLKRFGESHI